MMMVADPLAGRKLEKEGTVEAAMGTEIDVLDDGRLAQQPEIQPAGVSRNTPDPVIRMVRRQREAESNARSDQPVRGR